MLEHYLRRTQPFPTPRMRQLGLHWFLDHEDYFVDELLEISKSGYESYYAAGVELLAMYAEASRFVINQQLLSQLKIPESMHDIIRHTHTDPRYLNLVGRFDLAGGISGTPLKLLEYNANTTHLLPETALIQREQLEQSTIINSGQFNYLQKDLRQRLRAFQEAFPYHPPRLLVATLGHPLDDINAEFIGFLAEEVGFSVAHAHFGELVFSHIGIHIRDAPQQVFPFVYQSIGWDYLSHHRADLLPLLRDLILSEKVIFMQPPHTMLWQNKGLLKFIWDLNPTHPLLLKTDFTVAGVNRPDYVRKRIYGGEGENVTLYQNGKPTYAQGGNYDDINAIYQESAKLAQDSVGQYYQMSLFVVKEPSAICFRRKKHAIVDETAHFLGHFIAT